MSGRPKGAPWISPPPEPIPPVAHQLLDERALANARRPHDDDDVFRFGHRAEAQQALEARATCGKCAEINALAKHQTRRQRPPLLPRKAGHPKRHAGQPPKFRPTSRGGDTLASFDAPLDHPLSIELLTLSINLNPQMPRRLKASQKQLRRVALCRMPRFAGATNGQSAPKKTSQAGIPTRICKCNLHCASRRS